MLSFRDKLKKAGACNMALDWVGKKSFVTAWQTCKNEDYMLWIVKGFNEKDAISNDHYQKIRLAYNYGLRVARKYSDFNDIDESVCDFVSERTAVNAMRKILSIHVLQRAYTKWGKALEKEGGN